MISMTNYLCDLGLLVLLYFLVTIGASALLDSLCVVLDLDPARADAALITACQTTFLVGVLMLSHLHSQVLK